MKNKFFLAKGCVNICYLRHVDNGYSNVLYVFDIENGMRLSVFSREVNLHQGECIIAPEILTQPFWVCIILEPLGESDCECVKCILS
ncbi:hypothetical protein HanPSC8_Chr09g0401611 [Helianthus annuus]|nr:hypothetical protein HanPSC8_Chr09g0401611 [Helianthus annuus]